MVANQLAMNLTMKKAASQCQSPECGWLYLSNLTALKDVPPLLPNTDLSGIGVILGYSLSAYLTLLLLILHYITVHNTRRITNKSHESINIVDHGLLTFIRSHIVSWIPSKRFESALEKSVLILSDLNLVTGSGLLLAGYSQLKCGLSAYHWQVMVFIAWFGSFSFVSAMSFLAGSPQMKNGMRYIRLGLMVLLGSLLITALLPTGSRMWLNGDPDDSEGYYPGLHAVCFYEELGRPSSTRQGPKLWSMIFSLGILAVSYIYCGMRLISPSEGIPMENLRMRTGLKLRNFLDYMKRKTTSPRMLDAVLWHTPYLLSYAIFISIRAFYDICFSMLLEIIWLAFAMAWGTIKIWETRAAATWNFDGNNVTYNQKLSEENYWSFGQTLPLILLVLPLLSMAQTYLEEDAKEEDRMQPARNREEDAQRSANVAHAYETAIHEGTSSHDVRDHAPDQLVHLPIDPFADISSCPWYHDHITLLISQILMVSTMTLYFLTDLGEFLGISSILRSRLFVIWILGTMPLASFFHLTVWYAVALIIGKWPHVRQMLNMGERKSTSMQTMYWVFRLGLIGGCLVFTFFVSLELGDPNSLWIY